MLPPDSRRRRNEGLAHRALLLCTALLGLAAAPLHAQRNMPILAVPNLDPVAAADVVALQRLADGRYLVAGDFSRLNASAASGCARLRSDGSLDPSFVCGVSSAAGFAEDATGRIYVRGPGNFAVSRLLADGALDPGFTAIQADASITSLTVVGDALYIAGVFTQLNGQPRQRLARVNSSGQLDTTFAPAITGTVLRSLAPGDGFLYIAGGFTQIDGQARSGIARLALPAATLDSWTVSLQSSDGSVAIRALDADASHVYLSGNFNMAQGQTRLQLAKIGMDFAATLVADWAPQVLSGPTGSGPALLRVIGGSVYVGDTSGDHLISSNGQPLTRRLLRMTATGAATLDTGFDPFADLQSALVSSGATVLEAGDGGGRLFMGGPIRELSSGQIRLGLAAINGDGSVDTLSALPEALLAARVTQLASDAASGALYVLGDFVKVNGVLRQGLIRMRADGVVDSSFRPARSRYSAVGFVGNALYVADDERRQLQRLDPLSGDPFPGFAAIAYSGILQTLRPAGNHLYLLGNFTLSGITPSLQRYARMTLSNGQIDSDFRITANAGATIIDQSFDTASNSVFVHGNFSSLNGLTVNRLARIDLLDDSIDLSFAPVIPTTLSNILADGAGGLWLNGGFSSINGQTCRAPARLLIAGAALDPTFSCVRSPLGGISMAFALDSLYSVQGNAVRRYPRALGGTADPAWNLDVSNAFPTLLAVDNRLLLHGQFNQIGGAVRNALAAVPQLEYFFDNGFESP